MTTFATHDPRLEERVRDAWSAYRDSLAGLEGREYDEAESDAWEHLQATLRDIASDVEGVEADPGATA